METGNPKNQMQNYQYQGAYNNDEIDLYDLVEILVKNRITILITTVIVTLGALGGALVHRAGVYDKQGVNFSINNEIYNDFFYKKSGVNISPVEISDILNRDEVLMKLYEIPELKNSYEKAVKAEDRDASALRKFLNKKIMVKTVKQESVVDGIKVSKDIGGTLELNFEGDKELERKVGDLLLNIYSEKNLGEILTQMNSRENFVKSELTQLTQELEKKERELSVAVDREMKLAGKETNINEVLKLKYPKLMADMSKLSGLYSRMVSQSEGIEGFKKENRYDSVIRKTSSYYRIEVASKAKLILAVGMVLGLFLGIFMAFVKEFIEGYRKREKKN